MDVILIVTVNIRTHEASSFVITFSFSDNMRCHNNVYILKRSSIRASTEPDFLVGNVFLKKNVRLHPIYFIHDTPTKYFDAFTKKP
jgi:hypothetical protein